MPPTSKALTHSVDTAEQMVPTGPDEPTTPRRRRRRLWWVLLPVLGLVVAASLGAALVPIPYYALSPGSVRPTEATCGRA